MEEPPVPFDVRPLARQLPAYTIAHGVGILAPLVTLPYLTRVLGADGWAPVVIAQGLVALGVTGLDFGFDLTGPRDLSDAAPEHRPAIIAAVTGGKLLLAPIVLIAVLLLTVASRVHMPWTLRAATLACVLAKGLTPLWVFQGLERANIALTIETAGRIVAAALVFVCVRTPADGPWVMLTQAATLAVVAAIQWGLLRTHLTPGRVALRSSWHQIRHSAHAFGIRGAAALYQHLNPLLVAVLGSPAAVVAFGGAERIVRAGINLYLPITQALLPRARRTPVTVVSTGAWLIGGVGLLLASTCWIAAGPLVRVILGPGFESAIPLVRGLASLPIAIAIGTVLGLLWAVPSGRERAFFHLVLGAAGAALTTAILAIPRLGAAGMVAGVLVAEWLVALGLFTMYRRERAR